MLLLHPNVGPCTMVLFVRRRFHHEGGSDVRSYIDCVVDFLICHLLSELFLEPIVEIPEPVLELTQRNGDLASEEILADKGPAVSELELQANEVTVVGRVDHQPDPRVEFVGWVLHSHPVIEIVVAEPTAGQDHGAVPILHGFFQGCRSGIIIS